MRLERLEIGGFGALRDQTLEFHRSVTVVVGGNESGKSTVHRAIRAALYGIDAGGPGRAVDRSEWARWAPWTAGPYSLVLTYSLDDARRIRVARRLDVRDQPVQVLELGGSDLTDELRTGRTVSPGVAHLGIDEAVFCATAWLGDESLRLGAPDGSTAQAERLQEAIERLVDSRRGTTARRALALLGQAAQRVGSERRAGSPLGIATARLRELERAIADARRRAMAIAAEEERLRELERHVDEAHLLAEQAEREWLTARFLTARDRLSRAHDESRLMEEQLRLREELEGYAAVPPDLEARAAGLVATVTESQLAAAEADARWRAAGSTADDVRRRRAEIAAGLGAIAARPLVPDAAAACAELGQRAAAASEELQRLDAEAVADSRVASLRRELAATGLGSVSPEDTEPLTEMIRVAQRPDRRYAWGAAAAVAAAAAAMVLVVTHSRVTAIGAAVAGLIALGCVVLGVRAGRTARARGRRVTELERATGIGANEARAAAARVDALRSLHAALAAEERQAESRSARAAQLHGAVQALDRDASSLAAGCGLEVRPAQGASTAAVLDHATRCVDALRSALEAHRRRQQLEAEDSLLAQREIECDALRQEARRAQDRLEAVRQRLATLLESMGIADAGSPGGALARLRDAASCRRNRDDAARAAAGAQQRLSLLGDPRVLADLVESLGSQLAERGWLPPADAAAPPEQMLQQLEASARRARQAATSSGAQAGELRARLAGIGESGPSLADLENERDACALSRTESLRRLEALQLAARLIEEATQSTHRDIAPRLAELVTRRLDLLTEGRYLAVNVDTDRFAVALQCRERPDMVPLDVVSHGTRDQLSLLLRIALCEVLGSGRESIPLLLDEPLLTADPGRRHGMLEFLQDLSTTNQVVVTTSDPSVVTAVRMICGERCGVVELDSSARRVAPLMVQAG